MKIFWGLMIAVAAVGLLTVLIAYVCYTMAFRVTKKQRAKSAAEMLPPGEIYEPYHDRMRAWNKETRALAHKDFYTTSFDGLRLHGRYYEFAPGAPLELMNHGYRGSAERDLAGGVQRCFRLGRNCLITDQRTSCESGGKVISFGINESRDVKTWLDFIAENFPPEQKVILTGISMGGATVLIAGGRELPENVVGILADCAFTSAKDIIKTVIRQMKLPPDLCYPFVKLGARLFGHFDLEETSAIEMVKNCRVPVIFVHGEDDDFVPCEMSRRLYEACPTPKLLHTVPGAGHGLAFPADEMGYLVPVSQFSDRYIVPTQIVEL